MIKVLLMDDVQTDHGSMSQGPTACLSKHGFNCVFENGRDNKKRLLSTAQLQGERLYQRAKREKCDAVVLDHHWAHSAFSGFDIWGEAKKCGLALDNRVVVFVTQFERATTFPDLAQNAGFGRDQAQFKHRQGNEAVVRYLCNLFGVKFLGCMT